MQRSTKEVEIKLPFESAAAARQSVERLGAVPETPRLLEDNVLFDMPPQMLKESGRMLRLRRVGDRAVLTFKGPVEGEHRHKVREEHETIVQDADATARLIAGLGFVPCYRYQKYRTVYRLDGLEISLDETPLGCFVELEGEPETIDRAAAQMGFAPADYVCDSYRRLHEISAARRGKRLGDLLLDPPATDGCG